MKRIWLTLATAAALAASIATTGEVRGQEQAVAHGDSTHVSDWLNALPVSRAALAEYHRRKAAGLLPVAAKSTDEVGDTLTFKVWNFRESRGGRVVLDSIDFRLELESEHVRLWVELAELDRGRVTQATVENLFRALAEETPYASIDPGRGIMANSEALFGAPPDVNGDGLVDVLLLHIRDDDALFGVNVAGFVWSGDLIEIGNQRDMIYVDTESERAKTAAHEYQHLIHYNYDLHELTFVSEGLSRLSEVANGYNPADIISLDDAIEYDAPLLRFGYELSQDVRYLQADYFRAGLFTTYIAERVGYEAAGAITRDGERQGVDTYAAVMAQHDIALEDFILDFHTANALNRVDLHERYGYRSPVYHYVRARTPYDFDARVRESAAPIEVKVKEGAPTYFVWRHAPNLSIAVAPEQDSTSLRGVVLLQRDGQLEIAPLSIGAQANVFEGTYDRVTAVVVHVHPTNTGQGFERYVLRSSWESSGVAGSFSEDVEALKALFDSTDGNRWDNRDGWDFSGMPTPEELAMWHGVKMESGRVSRLTIRRNGLSGVIPDAIGNLTALRELTLYEESLRGTIPRTLGKLVQLQDLTLGRNDLEGRIPPELAELKELLFIFLGENRLTGEIPAELGSLDKLLILDLQKNALTGEIPVELGGLTFLQQVMLGNNRLTGTIPEELGNAVSLGWLDLGGNELAGTIPAVLGRLPSLHQLYLNDNALTGPIPRELGDLLKMNSLRLESNALTGGVPKELGRLEYLHYLTLHDNALTGEIPPSLGNLFRLKRLYLDNNALTGRVPKELGRLENLEYLYLYDNVLTGDLPPELGNLGQLKRLYLANNALTGGIPEELGRLENLEYLFLDHNALMGAIPPALGQLIQLERLTLSGNQLTGGMPEELGQLEKLELLRLSDNALTGPLPASLTNLRSLERLYFEGQHLCAPTDAAFQDWLAGLSDWRGRSCADPYALAFADTVDDQAFNLHVAIDTLLLPEATGGLQPYAYALSPALPPGLAFDAQARSITGTPQEVAERTTFTYAATDADLGSGSVTFDLEVIDHTGTETTGELPARLALLGNFPNPFRASTVVSYDLPAQARVSLHMFDVLGRRILVQTEESVEAGWQRTLTVDGRGLAPGVYLYRLIADLRPEPRIARGQMVLVR